MFDKIQPSDSLPDGMLNRQFYRQFYKDMSRPCDIPFHGLTEDLVSLLDSLVFCRVFYIFILNRYQNVILWWLKVVQIIQIESKVEKSGI